MKKFISGLMGFSLVLGFSITAEAKVSQNVMNNIMMIVSIDENENAIMTGTGFLISSSGHILTNEHVVRDGKTFAFCTQLPKQSTSECFFDYRLKLLAKDSGVDLALLQLPEKLASSGKQKTNYLTLGNSDLAEIGDEISIVGYPGTGLFTLNLAKGIISGFAENYIKTDARLFLGNSGGPAFNDKNQVIGIATAITSDDYQNIGLLIPSNTVRSWLTGVGFSSQTNDYTKSKVKKEISTKDCFDKQILVKNFAYCTYTLQMQK